MLYSHDFSTSIDDKAQIVVQSSENQFKVLKPNQASVEELQKMKFSNIAKQLKLDIVGEFAFECSIDSWCSRFIQDRLNLPID